MVGMINSVQVMMASGVELTSHVAAPKKQSRLKKRIETLEKYIQQYPSGWKKRLELADLFFSTGHWDNAIYEYRRVLEKKPKALDIWLKLGKILDLNGGVDDAVNAYSQALSLCHVQATQLYIAGLIETCKGQYLNALLSLQSATKLNPQHSAYWMSLGLTYLNTESPIEALAAFQTILQQVPGDVVALNYIHDTFLLIGDLPSAQSTLDQVCRMAPDDLGVMQRSANSYLRCRFVHGEQGKQTRRCIQTIIKLAPDEPGSYGLLARYYALQGLGKKGLEIIQVCTQTHAKNPGSWYHYGYFLFQAGHFSRAAEAMLKAYELYPHDYEIYRALYEICPFAQRCNELKPLMEKMVEMFPERWSVWAIAGRSLIEYFQNPTQGLEYVAKGLELQPKLADAWVQYGRALALVGQHEKAIATLETGWQKLIGSPNSQAVPIALWLGESYDQLGDRSNAQHWWEIAAEHALAIIPFHPAVAHYWYGKAMEYLGDRAEALSVYQTALDLHIFYPTQGEIEQTQHYR